MGQPCNPPAEDDVDLSVASEAVCCELRLGQPIGPCGALNLDSLMEKLSKPLSPEPLQPALSPLSP